MRSLLRYILEEYNSPDKIYFTEKNPTGDILRTFKWNNQNARPFFYLIQSDKTAFGAPTATHANLYFGIKSKDKQLAKEMGFDKYTSFDIRWDPDELDDEDKHITYDKWVEKHKDLVSAIHTGRIWDVRLEYDNSEYTPALFLSWWDEMTPKEFMNYNTSVINNYFEKKLNHDDKSSYIFYCVDNNGNVFRFDLETEKGIKIEKRSDESKVLLKTALIIHTADQKAKREFFANFRKTRDEKNQKIYNHTNSKTEAEYRALKYQESLKV